MKYLDDQIMDQVSGGAMEFLPGFLNVGLNHNPDDPKTVDAPMAALGGAQTAIARILAGPEDIANISSPYAPV